MSRPANTPALLRSTSFKGAEGLQGPLNDALKSIQERLSVLEQAQGIVLLGPRRCRLPINNLATPGSAVEFQLPEGFTPAAVFLVSMVAADVQALDIAIAPAAITYEIAGGPSVAIGGRANVVRLLYVNTTTSTGVDLDITLGAIRG
jgi:hypothetical protein